MRKILIPAILMVFMFPSAASADSLESFDFIRDFGGQTGKAEIYATLPGASFGDLSPKRMSAKRALKSKQGKLYGTIKKDRFVCSASIVPPNRIKGRGVLLMTAAHCVSDVDSRTKKVIPAKRMVFMIGKKKYPVMSARFHSAYYYKRLPSSNRASVDVINRGFDVAFAELSPKHSKQIASKFGYIGLTFNSVGSEHGQTVVTGFPRGKRYKACASRKNELNTLTNPFNLSNVGLFPVVSKCKMPPGGSGGPWSTVTRHRNGRTSYYGYAVSSFISQERKLPRKWRGKVQGARLGVFAYALFMNDSRIRSDFITVTR